MGPIKSGISPFEGLDHASPEPSLGQGQPTPEDLRLARGPPPAANIFPARPRPCCDTPGVSFGLCWKNYPNLGCLVKISISRSCLSLSIRLSHGSSPNSELFDREKQPILEHVKTFILGTNANSMVNLDL
jgi:hypothetical protein